MHKAQSGNEKKVKSDCLSACKYQAAFWQDGSTENNREKHLTTINFLIQTLGRILMLDPESDAKVDLKS